VEALAERVRRCGEPVRVLPETATRKLVDRRWPAYVLAIICLAALLAVAVMLLREGNFSPGEELHAPGFRDVAVSTENTSYPASDLLRFDRRPEVVYVYLVVEDLPSGGELRATVERSGHRSALAWLLGQGDDLEVSDEREEHLNPSGDGVSGVVKFAARTRTGEPLPAGNYTVSIYAGSGGTVGGDAAVRKYFVIRG
jgi:hypothetical protein